MAEYIEREAAYKDFEKCNSENPKWTPSRVKTLIARQKAADVAPVRHGRWTWTENGEIDWDQFYRCSKEDISEEIADVQIMLAQMILLFNLESEVEKWRNTKLERLRDRLSEVMA